MDFSKLITAGGDSGGGGGDFTTLLTGAATNPIGTAIGVLSNLGGLVGRPKTNEAQQSSDINTIAASNVMSGTDAAAVVAWHCEHSSDRFNDLAASLAGDSRGGKNDYFLRLLADYNSSHPNAPLRVGSAQGDQYTRGGIGVPYADAYTRGGIGVALPSIESQFEALVEQTNVNAMQNAAPQQAPAGASVVDQLKAILQGAAGGAKAGAATAAANTPYGQQATKETINSYIKDYQLPIAAAGIGLAYVFYRAFKS